VLLQKPCVDIAVMLIDRLRRSDPLPPAVCTVAGVGTMIYTEGFGTDLVWAEPIFVHVGFTVSAMR
jgi:hypothetical protein